MIVRVVAEIGQNHNGSVEVAKNLCHLAAHPRRFDRQSDEQYDPTGADAVKLCKRDLDAELSREQANSKYEGRHSFGDTYMAHRRRLELSWPGVERVTDHARSLGLDVGITLCAPSLVETATQIGFDFFKVASRDLTNLPLLEELASTDTPVVLSTGMAEEEDLEAAYHVLREKRDVTVCGCTSSYPCSWEDVHLHQIRWLRDWLARRAPVWAVGFSDHTVGTQAALAATALGIGYYEGHITLYRGMAGSDHAASKGPRGWWRICRDIRNIERGMGEYGLVVPDSVEPAQRKLERSIAASSHIEPGTVLGSSNTTLVSPGTGVKWTHRGEVFGGKAQSEFEALELIDPESVVVPSS